MEYKIYIQKFGGEFIGDYAFSAYEGFNHRGYKIKTFEDIEDVPVNKTNLVVGCIEDTTKYFEYLGIEVPKPLNIPICLMGYCEREIHVLTMKKFKENKMFPVFVKPYDKLKFFPSGVLRNPSSVGMFFNDVPDDFKVMTSEVVDMVSEYRCFVKNGSLIGIKNYIGDFKVFPDVDHIMRMIMDYEINKPPRSYTLDVAVTSDNRTVLIECNDGWSVGSYGLDGDVYSSFLLTRWNELMSGVK